MDGLSEPRWAPATKGQRTSQKKEDHGKRTSTQAKVRKRSSMQSHITESGGVVGLSSRAPLVSRVERQGKAPALDLSGHPLAAMHPDDERRRRTLAANCWLVQVERMPLPGVHVVMRLL